MKKLNFQQVFEMEPWAVFYEYVYGTYVKFSLHGSMNKEWNKELKRWQLEWVGVSHVTGVHTSFILTEGIEYYGPQIYMSLTEDQK